MLRLWACALLAALHFLTDYSVATAQVRPDALRMCYRADARPFSYFGENREPDGYSVALCKMMADELGVADIARSFVEITAQNRFTALGNGQCDVLCEATTITLSRRERFEFSLITFITGATILYRKDLLNEELNEGPFRFGLLKGTTVHEAWLRGVLKVPSSSQIVFKPFNTHEEARLAIADGMLVGHIADREILIAIKEQLDKAGKDYVLAQSLLSYEPYGIAFRIGDDRLRLAMDRVLARSFRSGRIESLLQAYFPAYSVSPRLRQLFEMQAIPE